MPGENLVEDTSNWLHCVHNKQCKY